MSYQKVYMNQVHSSTLLSQLAQMWKSQLLCDAIIKTGTVTTKAHRLVLVAACPMLQSMENASVGSHLEVRLAAEIKQDSVNTFLQYLYEGFMMLTEENVRDVEKVARLLQVESIITCCSDFDKCLRAKNGSLPPNAPYKYNFADLVEFRHVRTTDLQKTVQERMMKRAAEMSRPSSPGNKRQRMHKPSSDSHSDSFIGANRTDDTLSMSQSYMSGGSSGGSQWDRVPRIGSGMPLGRPGRDPQHMPGVIDIVDDSIELVQTEPPEKGGGKSDSKTVQKSVSVSISSQISTSDVQVVNVSDSDTSSKPSVTPTPSSSSSRGSITVSPLTIFDSPAGRDVSTNKSQDMKKDEPRQTDTGQSTRSESHSSQRSESHTPQRSDNHLSQRSPFPISLSSAQGSGQSKQFGPSGSQPKPFAAGSATQSSYSHSSPVSSTPPTSSPAPHSMNRNDNLERASPAEKSKSNLKQKEPPESSTADMTPDLSIVKIESRNSEIDTGGLDMYVDMPEQGVMQLHRRTDDDQGEGSDIEYEEPSGDWSREDMSNEGSNISGDQNNSWYVGNFKGGEVENKQFMEQALEQQDILYGVDYKCSICKNVFSSKSDLQRHVMMHDTVSHILCRICGFPFVDQNQLQQHLLSDHVRDYVEFCLECGKGFKTMHGYRAHQSMQHTQGVAENHPQCNICGKYCISNSNLKIHQRSHSKHKPFHCSKCFKSYKHKKDLKDHYCKPFK